MSEPVRLPIISSDARVDALDELFARGLAAQSKLAPLGDGPAAAEAMAALARVLDALRAYRIGEPNVVFALSNLGAEALHHVDDALGQGEITVDVDERHRIEIRETALPGVWRVRERSERGAPLGDYLEIGDVPAVVRAADELATCDDLSIGQPPEGAMNVLPVLAELRHRMKRWSKGQPNHVLSLSLLPMNEVDMRYLERQLRHGPVLAESKGYGRCRVELTGHRHVWSVQFFNSAGALILDTLEVGDAPVAMRAGAEDFEDSAERLAQLLGL